MLFAIPALALAASLAAPQEAPPPDEPDAQAAEADPYEALHAEYEAAEAEWNERYTAAKTEEERAPLWETWPGNTYVARFRALAEEHAGEDCALPAWRFVVQHGGDEVLEPALAALARDFLDREELGDVCMEVYTIAAPAKAFFETLLAESPHESARGKACFALAGLLSRRAKTADRLAGMKPEEREAWTGFYGADTIAQLEATDPAELRASAERTFERAAGEFGDVKVRRRALKDAAASELFELRHLQVGMVAPPISGEDVDGVAFSTADLKGKVVVLDFWGDW